MNLRVVHPLEPIFDEHSRALILGTMPSPKSREVRFYYGHPQNRFWRILSALFAENTLNTVSEKAAFLLQKHIALWDVFSACDIKGADDSSIRNAIPNDLDRIFDEAEICAVFTNGQKASAAYKKYFEGKYPVKWVSLPSTSPANCRNWTCETLSEAYSVILEYL